MRPLPGRRRHPGMVREGRDTVGTEPGCKGLGPIPRCGVDDPCIRSPALQVVTEALVYVLFFLDDEIPEVLPVETPDIDRGVVEVELPRDIVTDVRRRGRSQGDHRHLREPLFQDLERPVLGAELVPPHRYAVRFVDSDERYGEGCDEGEEVIADRLLRRDVEDLDDTLFKFREDPPRRYVGTGGVQRFCRDPAGLQVVNLVFHQGDEG